MKWPSPLPSNSLSRWLVNCSIRSYAMRMRIQLLVLLSVIVPISAWSCEPILPLAQLLSGSSAIGALMWRQSLLWLVAAVAVKSVAFAFFERKFLWWEALYLMFLANV